MTHLIAYASRTGTKRNLAALRAAGWRLLVSATGALRAEGFRYCLDNGAWTAFVQGRPFDERLFGRALTRMGRDADFVIIPDVVAGGTASLALSLSWMRTVLDATERGLIAVQDGISEDDVAHLLGPRVGIFVGGSTDWKLRTLDQWGALGRKVGCWCHVGRVNSKRRISACAVAGATSFDGTSASRFALSPPSQRSSPSTRIRLEHALTISITKEWNFDAAHFLPNLPKEHKCSRMHGHTYRVQVTVKAWTGLDERGFIVDYAELEAAWKGIEGAIDHRILNEVPGLENPTTEVLTPWMAERFARAIPAARVVSVRVYESSTTYCEWCA